MPIRIWWAPYHVDSSRACTNLQLPSLPRALRASKLVGRLDLGRIEHGLDHRLLVVERIAAERRAAQARPVVVAVGLHLEIDVFAFWLGLGLALALLDDDRAAIERDEIGVRRPLDG